MEEQAHLIAALNSVKENWTQFLEKFSRNQVEIEDIQKVFPLLKGVLETESPGRLYINDYKEAVKLMGARDFQNRFKTIVLHISQALSEDPYDAFGLDGYLHICSSLTLFETTLDPISNPITKCFYKMFFSDRCVKTLSRIWPEGYIGKKYYQRPVNSGQLQDVPKKDLLKLISDSGIDFYVLEEEKKLNLLAIAHIYLQSAPVMPFVDFNIEMMVNGFREGHGFPEFVKKRVMNTNGHIYFRSQLMYISEEYLQEYDQTVIKQLLFRQPKDNMLWVLLKEKSMEYYEFSEEGSIKFANWACKFSVYELPSRNYILDCL